MKKTRFFSMSVVGLAMSSCAPKPYVPPVDPPNLDRCGEWITPEHPATPPDEPCPPDPRPT